MVQSRERGANCAFNRDVNQLIGSFLHYLEGTKRPSELITRLELTSTVISTVGNSGCILIIIFSEKTANIGSNYLVRLFSSNPYSM